MIRYAVLSVLWVSSLALATAMARQDQPPVSPTQKLAESLLSGQQVISGNDIGFRVTSVRNRGTAVDELTVGQLMVRVNGVWREATFEATPRVIPVH